MNKGLDLARGEYVGIVESDDFASVDMFEVIYKAAKKHDVDVVRTNYLAHRTECDPGRTCWSTICLDARRGVLLLLWSKRRCSCDSPLFGRASIARRCLTLRRLDSYPPRALRSKTPPSISRYFMPHQKCCCLKRGICTTESTTRALPSRIKARYFPFARNTPRSGAMRSGTPANSTRLKRGSPSAVQRIHLESQSPFSGNAALVLRTLRA